MLDFSLKRIDALLFNRQLTGGPYPTWATLVVLEWVGVCLFLGMWVKFLELTKPGYVTHGVELHPTPWRNTSSAVVDGYQVKDKQGAVSCVFRESLWILKNGVGWSV